MKFLKYPAVFALCAGFAALSSLLGCSESPTGPIAVGSALPTFSLPTLDGSNLSSDSLMSVDTATVINFWATWCSPCRKETPELLAAAADPALQVVGIALDEAGASSVAPFVEARGIEYPILLGNQDVFQRLGGVAIPYTLVVDPTGLVIGVHRGPVTKERLLEDLAEL